MDCKWCYEPIPKERLELIPDADSCVPCKQAHGDDEMPIGHMVYPHKTGGYIEIVTKEQHQHMNDIDRRGLYKNRNAHKKDLAGR